MKANEVIKQYSNRLFLAKETKMQSECLDDWHCHPWHQVIFPISGLLQSSVSDKNYIVPHNGFYLFLLIFNISLLLQFLAIYLNPHKLINCSTESVSGLVSAF